MTAYTDLMRRQALCELLARSDRFDLLRCHRVVLEGDPERFSVVPKLASAYIQAKLLEMRCSSLRR